MKLLFWLSLLYKQELNLIESLFTIKYYPSLIKNGIESNFFIGLDFQRLRTPLSHRVRDGGGWNQQPQTGLFDQEEPQKRSRPNRWTGQWRIRVGPTQLLRRGRNDEGGRPRQLPLCIHFQKRASKTWVRKKKRISISKTRMLSSQSEKSKTSTALLKYLSMSMKNKICTSTMKSPYQPSPWA